jgi:hypothetical protein
MNSRRSSLKAQCAVPECGQPKPKPRPASLRPATNIIGRKSLSLVGLLLGLATCQPLPEQRAPAPPAAFVAQQHLPPGARPDLDPRWYDASGNFSWPPNDGFAAAPVAVTLPPGMLLDRFGSPGGRFFSPQGAPYSARALPYVCPAQVYTVYKVHGPLAVQSGTAASWFGEPGGAIQYKSGDTAAQLLTTGKIETTPDPGPAPCDRK